MNYKVFVINLDDRPDKFENAKKQLDAQGIKCERISAIRGNLVPETEIKQNYDAIANKQHYLRTMSVGEIGCYMSHRKAWKKIVDENLDYAIILEDDCKPQPDFYKTPNLLEGLVGWHYIKLTGPRGGKTIQNSAPLKDGYSIAHYNKVPIATPGQVVSQEGAKILLKNSQPFFRPVDVDLQHYWEKKIDVIGLEPKLVDTAGFDSDITAMDQKSTRKKSASFWSRVKYRLSTALDNSKANKKRPSLKKYLQS